jgi:RNA polymerase sigma factor (sigma-70 family)
MFVGFGTLLSEGVEVTTDRQLVTRASHGDAKAFTEFYDRYAANVLRYAFALSADSDDAQDLLQETFITAWRKRSELGSGASSALPWLLVTCRNNAYNLRRSKTVRRTVPLDEARESGGPDDTLDRLARDEELRWVLSTIEMADPIDRSIVAACIVAGMPYREAAEQFGLSAQAVAKRVQRLRTHLTGLRAARQGAET